MSSAGDVTIVNRQVSGISDVAGEATGYRPRRPALYHLSESERQGVREADSCSCLPRPFHCGWAKRKALLSSLRRLLCESCSPNLLPASVADLFFSLFSHRLVSTSISYSIGICVFLAFLRLVDVNGAWLGDFVRSGIQERKGFCGGIW